MATGFGVPGDQNGNGTTPDDIQVITGAEYANPGILAGCQVTTTTATNPMGYKVAAGAVVLEISTGRMVKVPVAPATIPAEAAPAVGTRTDILYVKQNFPGTDGSSAAVIGVGTTVPKNAQEIKRFTVPAGATSTSQFTVTGNPIYARPIGGTLGNLGGFIDVDDTIHEGEEIRRAQLNFYVPTDRFVEVSMKSCISSYLAAANGQTATDGGSVIYKFYIDGTLWHTWERAYTTYWESKHFEFGASLPVGAHTFYYTVQRRHIPAGGSGKWRVRYGTVDKFPGDVLTITDRGVWKG